MRLDHGVTHRLQVHRQGDRDGIPPQPVKLKPVRRDAVLPIGTCPLRQGNQGRLKSYEGTPTQLGIGRAIQDL